METKLCDQHSSDIELVRTYCIFFHQVDNTTELASTPSDKEDSSYKYIQNPDLNGSHVTVCDINENMLEVGRNKFVQQGYTQGDFLTCFD